MPLPLSDPDRELQRIMGAETERRRMAHYRSMANPRQAATLAQYGSQMPWMNGKVAMALSSQGIPPEAPVAQEAGRRSVAKKASGILGGIGTLVSAPLRQALKIARPVFDQTSEIIKPVTRTAFTALSAPLEEIQGLARAGVYGFHTGDWDEAFSRAGGSTARLAIGDMLEGKRVELGTGFFAGMKEGSLGAEQQQLARRLKINDEWISIGRTVADTVFDPGETGYKFMSGVIDGAIAIGADPANIALAGLSKVRQAHKLIAPGATGVEAFAQGARKAGFGGRAVARALRPAIEANAGMVNGRSRSVLQDQAERFLANPELEKLYTKWGDQNYGFQQIWEDSGRQMDVRLAALLGDASNADEARALIRRAAVSPDPKAGIVLTEKRQLGVAGAQDTGLLGRFSDGLAKLDAAKRSNVNRSAPRLFRQMPKGTIDIRDFEKSPAKLNEAVEQFDALQRLLKLDPDQIADNNRRLATINHAGEAYEIVINNVLGDSARGALVRNGASPEQARQATRLWEDYHRDMMRYFVDEVGENVPIPGLGLDGTAAKLPSPTLLSEALSGLIPLPDARRLRRMTAAPWVRAITEIPGYQGGVQALDWLMFQVWRPMALLRGAWTVRVVGEEQFRMEAAGLDAPLFHPLQYIGNLVRKGREDVTFAGDDLQETVEFKESLSKIRNFLEDPGRRIIHDKVTYAREDPQYARSLVAELAELNVDELARRVAQNGPEFVKGWVRATAEGQELRQKYRDILQNPIFDTNEGMAQYIDEVIMRRIQAKTGGNKELMDAVRTGRIRGQRLLDVDDERGVYAGANARAVKNVRALVDEAVADPASPWAAVLPERVKGSRELAQTARDQLGARRDKVVQTLFNTLMGRPTNTLSRSESFRQFYWTEGERLIQAMTPEAQQVVLRQLDRARIPEELAQRVREGARRSSGELGVKDADMMAKASALEQTKGLLYDVSQRGNFADVYRHVFPFAEAWKEVLTRWATIGFEHPESLRRGQQIISGARGAGFFQTDPETGEEVFVYPGSKLAMQAFAGTPFPLTGEVAGLNIFSQSVLPGFGPVVQIAANKLLPNKPEFDEVLKVISPYGDPTEQEGVVSAFLPAWARRLQKAMTDPETDRLFGNTVIDVQNYLFSTGEYDTQTLEGRQALQDEAIARARLIYIARAMATFGGAPSAPRPRAMAQDKNGDLLVQRLMVDDLRNMQNENYDTAIQRFMEKYGDEALLFLQPKTYAVVPGAPTTDKGLDWVRDNPDLVRAFPNVYGYFAPQEGEFDYTAYLRTIKSGEREALTPAEQLALAHDKYASMIFYNEKNKLGRSVSDEQRAALRNLKETLQKKFPGFGTATAGLPERAEKEQLVAELQEAVENPQLANTPGGQALKIYLQARDEANLQAQQLGLKGYAEGKAARPLRDAMRNLGTVLSQKAPQFALMYDRILEDEMDADEEATVGIA